jgi:glycosyltransferase 2 family protein
MEEKEKIEAIENSKSDIPHVLKTSNKRKKIWQAINVAIVVGIGIFLVYFLLRQVNFNDLKTAFLNMDIAFLVIGLVIMFIQNIFRAYQKKILIGNKNVNMGDLFMVTLIRNGLNMVLPARTGEISYVYVLKKKFNLPVEIGVSTLVLILIFDLVMVFSLIVIAIIIVGINKYAISSALIIVISVALLAVALIILFFLPKIIGFILKLLNRLLLRYRIGKNKAIQFIYKKLVDINVNIIIIQKRRVYWKVYLISLVIRVLKFVSYYFIILAIMKPMGYSFANLSFWVIFLGTVVAEISAVLPTHALAGFGTYEGAFALSFVILGFTKEMSIIVGFNYHLIILLFSVSLSILAMIILSMPFYRVRNVEKQSVDNKGSIQ